MFGEGTAAPRGEGAIVSIRPVRLPQHLHKLELRFLSKWKLGPEPTLWNECGTSDQPPVWCQSPELGLVGILLDSQPWGLNRRIYSPATITIIIIIVTIITIINTIIITTIIRRPRWLEIPSPAKSSRHNKSNMAPQMAEGRGPRAPDGNVS